MKEKNSEKEKLIEKAVERLAEIFIMQIAIEKDRKKGKRKNNTILKT